MYIIQSFLHENENRGTAKRLYGGIQKITLPRIAGRFYLLNRLYCNMKKIKKIYINKVSDTIFIVAKILRQNVMSNVRYCGSKKLIFDLFHPRYM